jgi:hypothetical protein
MPSQAYVCPHCRTWVEGSGRSIRCPSCGKRFSADAARLGATPQRQQDETLDYAPVATGEVHRPAADYEARDYSSEGYGAPSQRDGPQPNPEQTRSGLNLGVLFTVAFIALFLVGRQFLGPEVFIGLIFLLIAGRWLFDRQQSG